MAEQSQTVVMFKNSWTSALGILAGATNYLAQDGLTVPTNRQQWMNLLFSAFLAGIGIVAKDATTGSKPGG